MGEVVYAVKTFLIKSHQQYYVYKSLPSYWSWSTKGSRNVHWAFRWQNAKEMRCGKLNNINAHILTLIFWWTRITVNWTSFTFRPGQRSQILCPNISNTSSRSLDPGYLVHVQEGVSGQTETDKRLVWLTSDVLQHFTTLHRYNLSRKSWHYCGVALQLWTLYQRQSILTYFLVIRYFYWGLLGLSTYN